MASSAEIDTSHFRRGQSKVFYESDARWDPGASTSTDLEARTSFRSSCKSDPEDDDAGPDTPSPEPVGPAGASFASPAGGASTPLLRPDAGRLTDILEEESSDEHSEHSHSAEFRIPRGSSIRRSQDSQESSSTDSSCPTSRPPRPVRPGSGSGSSSAKGLGLSLSHRSQDSGFSDSGDSNPENSTGLPKPPKKPERTSLGQKGTSNKVHSEVVHETRTSSFDPHRQYHVSKVYFYSVSDILSQEKALLRDSSAAAARDGVGPGQHVSILECHRSESPEILLSPPRSPPGSPPPQCSPFYTSLEHKPLPVKGTQTLGRKAKGSPSFPKTNGSLCDSHSLARRSQQHPSSNASGGLDSSFGSVSLALSSLSPSPGFAGGGGAASAVGFDSFDDPLLVNRQSFHSLEPAPDHVAGAGDAAVDDDLAALLLDQTLAFSPPRRNCESSSTVTFPGSSLPAGHGQPARWHHPVQFWLTELSQVHEAECTIMLQSKPVVSPGQSSSGDPSPGLWSGSSKDTIRAIQTKAHSISAAFAKLCRQLGHRSQASMTKLVPLVQSLSHQVQLFLVEYNTQNNSSSSSGGSRTSPHHEVDQLQLQGLPGYRPSIKKAQSSSAAQPEEETRQQHQQVPEEVLHQQRLLLQSCDRLKLCVSRHQSASSQNLGDVVEVITSLGATFTKLIELMLSKEIKKSVDALDVHLTEASNCSASNSASSRFSALRGAIEAIITLALEGNHLCRLIAKHGGIRSLLTISVEPKLRPVRVNAFRALGTVCCVLEGIMELEEGGGIEVLSDTLRDTHSTEEEKSEAAGLLAQVTSPWIENNSSIEGLSKHLEALVESLTALSAQTCSAETFLLSSAALANLTFMEPTVISLLRTHGTARVLVSSVRAQAGNVSIYIQDQVAAVLANMAASAECRSEVVRHGGLPVLLQFLRARAPASPGRPEDYAQMAATERVLQKSAIAISRLCNDPSLASEVIRLDGLRRLVELCKDERARVGSDGVLVSCLAAVRKVAQACGRDQFQALDAAELVEPRLLDSFLIFSSKNESFV